MGFSAFGIPRSLWFTLVWRVKVDVVIRDVFGTDFCLRGKHPFQCSRAATFRLMPKHLSCVSTSSQGRCIHILKILPYRRGGVR